MKTQKSRAQGGFSLIEALVAFIVVAFGMLALAGMQLSLSRSADVAKQRTEAMRLAQDKMEALRSFTSLTTGTVNWNAMTGGSDTISSYSVGGTDVSTNASYARTWSIGGASTDAQRSINVAVAWTDRASDAQSVSLTSVIARIDPQDAGFLAFPLPENTTLKRPKNRNLNIPIQARDLGGGKSAYQLPSGFAVVFSDVTGYVVEKCTTSDINATNYNDGTANCTTYSAYILAGYVSGSVANSSGVATMPTGINTSSLSGWDSSGGKIITCSYAQAQDQNSSTTSYIAGYQYYICVIPVATGGSWSGTVRLGGVTTTGNYKVCRFQYGASDFVNDNERNSQGPAGSPTGYAGVNESLDNQNYYIESSNSDSCPTVGTNVTGVTGGTVATVLHQNCRSSASPTTTASGTCPATAWNAAASAP